MFLYRVYGLVIASELVLPDLFPALPEEEVQLRVLLGRTPSGIPDWSCFEEGFFFEVEGVARFWVESGRRIVVERLTEDDSAVRLYLLGSAFAAALYQRNILPLHASSVVFPDGVRLFLGPSGMGKSTLAAALAGAGFALLSDDVTPICFARGMQTSSAPSRLRLLPESVEQLGLDVTQSRELVDKKWVFKPPRIFRGGALPVASLYFLRRGPFSIRPLDGADRFAAILANIYRGSMVELFRVQERVFNQVVRLSGLPCWELYLPSIQVALQLARHFPTPNAQEGLMCSGSEPHVPV
ncbi:hypothetical protein JST97_19065 [bacterium]|nr:hypothetical protein [bacterium]